MLKKIKKAGRLFCFYIYNRIVACFVPICKNKMLFCTEAGDQITGNLKCMYDYFSDNKYEKIIYAHEDRRDKRRLAETLSLWKDLTVAKYVFLDDFYTITSTMKVRKGQELIQLWHGAGAYKKFGFSRIGTGDNIRNINSGYRKYTKVITSSEDIRPLYAEAFDIDLNKVKATGCPRTDVFFDDNWKKEVREKIYNQYPQLWDKKVVLFAPTYRGRKIEDADYNFDYANLDELQNELGDEYAILTRWHPALQRNIKKGIKKKFCCNHVLDMSEYKDVNELLVITDVLITDYSSVIFDYFFMNKPIIYFVYDLEKYKAGSGLYYDFDKYVYGDVVLDRRLLAQSIKAENQCEEKRKAFGNKFLSACDGQSTKKTAEYILGKSNI